MKKWALILVLAASVGSIYIFIPSQLTFSKIIKANCSVGAANRCFSDTSKWVGWWPAGYDHAITGIFYNEVRLRTTAGESVVNVIMRIAQSGNDSIRVGWECSLPVSYNPWKRILAYRQRKVIGDHMEAVLNSFKSYAEDGRNIYGVVFKHTFSKDSTLITLSGVSNGYPTTATIYGMIDSLKQYAGSQRAAEIDYPMLNVSKLNDTQYRLMVALSLNRTLAGNKRIIVKRFVPWKMIEGEVHGGAYTAEKALKELYNFRDDYQLSIMAIPFQSLITDRSKVQDSTKWVTKVCAPIS